VTEKRRFEAIPGALPRAAALLVVAGSALAVFAALGSLTWPFGRDQGIFAWVGEVILDGGAPYSGAWDMKGPLSYYLYALALGAFDRAPIGIRILDLTAALACCTCVMRLVLSLTPGARLAACSAAIFFALTYYGGGFWNTAQPETWAGLLILLAVYELLNHRKAHWVTLAAAGAMIAVAMLLKPTFAVFLALPALHLASEPGSWSTRGGLLAICLATAAMTTAVAMGLLSQASGGLHDFMDVLQFVFLSHSSVEHRHLATELATLPLSMARIGLLAPLLLTPVGLVLLRQNGQRREALLLAAWCLLSVLVVVVQGKYWFYHWMPAVIAVAATLGVTLSRLGDTQSATVPGYLRTAAAIPLIFVVVMATPAVRAAMHSYQWPRYAMGIEGREEYLAHFSTPDGGWRYPSFETIAAYIAPRSNQDDRVLVWGWDPLINVLARRKSPTRFGFAYPLTAPGPLQERYRQVFLRELASRPPRYIVVDANAHWSVVDAAGLDLLKGFPDLYGLLHSHYRLVMSVAAFQVWEMIA